VPDRWTWDHMIEEFRALGGIADNVCLRAGALGRGIFPLDPSQPIKLQAAKNLLFPLDDIAFEGDTLRVKHSVSGIGRREKEFFDTYQQTFSWGAGGRDECAGFLAAMDALPTELRDLLAKKYGLSAIFQGAGIEQAKKRFLKSRRMRIQGRQVLMPVVELVNHDVNGVEFQYNDGIAIHGIFADEVLVHYSLCDPLDVLMVWGFASQEPLAFGLPAWLPLGTRRLIIRRNFDDVWSPAADIDGEKIVLSHLMLTNARNPKLPKDNFYKLMQDLGLKQINAEEVFNRILHANREQFLKLSAALAGHDGEAVTLLRKTCQYQIIALSCP
jgi:hypothetical protein